MSRSVRQAYPFRNIDSAGVKITPPEEKIVFKVGEGVVIEEVKPLEIKPKVVDAVLTPEGDVLYTLQLTDEQTAFMDQGRLSEWSIRDTLSEQP